MGAERTERDKENASGKPSILNPGPRRASEPENARRYRLVCARRRRSAYNLFKQVYDENPDSDPPGALSTILTRASSSKCAARSKSAEIPADPEAYLQLAGIDAREGRFLEARLLIERAEAHRRTRNIAQKRPPARIPERRSSLCAPTAERRERYEEARTIVQKILGVIRKTRRRFGISVTCR